jgi:sulfur-carrier protein
MQITVKLFATFRAGRFAQAQRDYAAGTCVADVVRELQIAESEIGMIMVNGRHADPDHRLEAGASLSLFPLLGGG